MAAKKKAAVSAMKNPKAEIYQDRKNQWRWRLYAKNGRIVADSGEGYNSKTVAKNRLALVMNLLSLVLTNGKVEVTEKPKKVARKKAAAKK